MILSMPVKNAEFVNAEQHQYVYTRDCYIKTLLPNYLTYASYI